MPGKEADFPSRKERKAAGKNGIMGRAAAGGGNVLPLYERERSGGGKGEVGSISYGYARDAE